MKNKLEVGDWISFREKSFANQNNDKIDASKKYKILSLKHCGSFISDEHSPYRSVHGIFLSEIGEIKGTYYDPLNNPKIQDASIIYCHYSIITEELEI